MIRVLFILSLIFLFSNSSIAQGYEIKIQVKPLTDSTIYLANYFGAKMYYADTAKINKKGLAVFSGTKALKGGKYSIVTPGPKFFEVLIDEDQHFEIITDTTDLIMNFHVKGSAANQLYYEYVKYINARKVEVSELNQVLIDPDTDSTASKKASKRVVEINKEVQEYQSKLVKENPKNWAAIVINMSIAVPILDAPKNENGVVTDSLFQYRYYLDHFFDHMPLDDPRIVRTPEFDRKLKDYFTTALLQDPDTIAKYADRTIQSVTYDPDLFKYIVHFCTYSFETSNIMGMDAAFVHMIENYYMTGKATWMDSTNLANVTERAMKMKPTLLGQKAPFMRMADSTGTNFISLYDVDADYTVIYIWDPDCGHCKKENPKMVQLYEKYAADGVKVYAVGNPYENEEWIEYLRTHKEMNKLINVSDSPAHPSPFRTYYDVHSTPVVLLLDKNKKIIAKKVGTEQLDSIIERELKKQK
jgi:thiol-disulfide isomerase/thioredoxin